MKPNLIPAAILAAISPMEAILIITVMMTMLAAPARADAMPEPVPADHSATAPSAEPDDPDSPFTEDGRCKPGRLGCFWIEPDEDEPPPDATALRIMHAVQNALQRLETTTPHSKEH